MTRIGLYVDCSTLWTGSFNFAKQHKLPPRPRVNYRQLRDSIRKCFPASTATVLRAYIVAGPNVLADGFRIAMEGFGYETKVVGGALSSERTARGAIYTDVSNETDKWDVLVLATQDPYYLPLVEELRGSGKLVHVAAFPALPPEYAHTPYIELGERILFQAAERRV